MKKQRARSAGFLRVFWRLFLLAAFCLIGQQAQCRDRPDLDQPYFKILDATPQLGQRIDSILLATTAELTEYGGVSISDTITVLVATRREQFDSAVGGHFPDWGVGCAIPEKNTIVILSPYLFPYRRSFVEVVRHELAHIYLHRLVGWPRIPRWMDEGFAMLIAHEWRFGDDWFVARAVFSGETLPLLHIEGLNLFKEGKARLAYTQSYLAMSYFLEEHGWESVLLFFRELRRRNDWDAAFMMAVGLDYAGFQQEYSKFLAEKYNWASLFSDTVLMWMLLVLLILVLYLLKRWRTKKKLDEWERTDPVQDIFYPAGEIPPDQSGH